MEETLRSIFFLSSILPFFRPIARIQKVNFRTYTVGSWAGTRPAPTYDWILVGATLVVALAAEMRKS